VITGQIPFRKMPATIQTQLVIAPEQGRVIQRGNIMRM
jgi:hypothetical protein